MTRPLTSGSFAANIGFLQHRPGDCIKSRYDVLERLGGGNFGSVYRVRDTAVGNVLACKEMHVLDNPETQTDERAAALDLFRREALNLATIRHPNIPAAYFDQEDGEWRVCPVCGLDYPSQTHCPQHGAPLIPVSTRYYLMMDFVDGPTLEDLAATEMRTHGRPLPEARCLEWIHQIGTALRTLHRVGIIHRDVKPENIKIRAEDDVAVLLDFGLTKKVEEAGGYGTAPLTGTARFGTAGYAPENPRERDRPERRSDIHALGMTLYRLVSGRDPQDEQQQREMREHSPRYFNREITPATEQLIQVSIAGDLARRYQSIDDFLRDLDEIRAPQSAVSGLPPFTFADGARARNATELARLLDSHKAEARNYLLNGMFATWLLQYGFAAPAQAAEQVAKVYSANPDRALEIFRRSLYPTGTSHVLPVLEFEPATLNFGAIDSGSKVDLKLYLRNTGPGLAWGKIYPERKHRGAGAPTGLAAAVQSILAGQPEEEDTSLPGLRVTDHFQGNSEDLELTLDTAKVPMGSYSSHLVIETDWQTYRIPVSYTVVPLELRPEPEVLDFGSVQVGRRVERELAIVPIHPTIGRPRGTVYTGPSLAGIIAPDRFDGSDPFTVVLDAGLPSATARHYDGLIQVDTNGGRLRVPVRYRIVLPPGAFASVLASAIFWGAIAGGALRFVYSIVNPAYTVNWLLKISPGGPVMTSLELRGLGVLIAGAAAGLYGGWWYGGQQRQLPRHERSGYLKDGDDTVLDTLPMFGLFFGAFGGYLTAQLLHWTFWSLGDWLLYPVAKMIPGPLGDFARQYAPVTWTFAGAIGGLVWGVGRILTATGRQTGRYFVVVAAAVAFLALMLNAMLAPVS